MAMDTKGGRGTIDIDGVRYSARGAAKIMPSTVSLENGANMDGTGYSTVKPELAGVDFSFDRGVFPWTDDLILKKINVTWVETDTGWTHLFTGARFSGKPEIDTEKGEVTGLKIETDSYQVIKA